MHSRSATVDPICTLLYTILWNTITKIGTLRGMIRCRARYPFDGTGGLCDLQRRNDDIANGSADRVTGHLYVRALRLTACLTVPMLGIGLTGCTVGPDYRSPEIKQAPVRSALDSASVP